jgi:hypothetical protein
VKLKALALRKFCWSFPTCLCPACFRRLSCLVSSFASRTFLGCSFPAETAEPDRRWILFRHWIFLQEMLSAGQFT